MNPYCKSRFQSFRRLTREVRVGSIGVGKDNPVRLQSMTTTPTQDVDATVEQSIRLVEAGCEIVRITAQNVKAAEALKDISKKLRDAKINVPLAADIHFLPQAAMVAVEHVDKVRINPGNYADKKKFAVKEYTDKQYDDELLRLHESFSPLVKRCKELGKSIRIGTNHGSLSDRIMNRYGDSPLGMAESALEFIRIAESHSFKDIILSMKSSNPKVMIQAYRLVVAKMDAEKMNYPLHLGVTEAGDGEDARIKSSIGIGSLLFDGLGDTIRVSLTEDPVYEIPVAKDLADKAMTLWNRDIGNPPSEKFSDSIDPYSFNRRIINEFKIGEDISLSSHQPPAVVVSVKSLDDNQSELADAIIAASKKLIDSKIEGIIISHKENISVSNLNNIYDAISFLIVEITSETKLSKINFEKFKLSSTIFLLGSRDWVRDENSLLNITKIKNIKLALEIFPDEMIKQDTFFKSLDSSKIIYTLSNPDNNSHPMGSYRSLAENLKQLNILSPIWIRNTNSNAISIKDHFGDRLLEASILTGSLLCDGIGDMISIETEPDLARATTLAYNILQGARARVSKTEYVACPSCGRTLFDLQSTTQRIREYTNHLKGVTIAVMGCIVNGPGEMADADFGYVGGAPGKINLYVGKNCVRFNIPENEAVDQLINLIKEEGKWVEEP